MPTLRTDAEAVDGLPAHLAHLLEWKLFTSSRKRFQWQGWCHRYGDYSADGAGNGLAKRLENEEHSGWINSLLLRNDAVVGKE
jgi:hypothetical protein